MKEIVRVYVIDQRTGKEKGVMDPEKIIGILSTTTEDVDLDYDIGNDVKMGSSRELIGETVKVGDMDMVIPEH